MIEILSYGGGVQSVALCVLIGKGVLPKPDLAGIADTSREVASTWEYLYGVMQPWLDQTCGLKVEVVPHTLATKDLYATSGLTLVPAYTRTLREFDGLYGPEQDTVDGRLPTYCSGEWKREVMLRWYRLKGVKACRQWIGYSTDEAGRVGEDRQKWCANRYPLLEQGISRAMCGEIIRSAGLPMPKKSRCFICPHQSPEEWQEVKSRPEEFAAAVALERQINDMDPDATGTLFLYSGRVSLSVADFQTDAGIVPPARPCETSSCWT